jgi:hypothetical protein
MLRTPNKKLDRIYRIKDIRTNLKNPLSLEGEGGGEGENHAITRSFAPHPTLSPEGRGIMR